MMRLATLALATTSSTALLAGMPAPSRLSSSRMVQMNEYDDYMEGRGGATRDSAPAADGPDVRFDTNTGWSPDKGTKDFHGGANFEATDTPDFFDDSEYSQKAGNIGVMDGVMGSTGLDKLKEMQTGRGRSSDPGVAGALDVNPDVYTFAEELSAEKRGIVFELKKSGMTDLDLEMTVDSVKGGAMPISVMPVCMTFEEFYCGFTADSHPAFSVSPTEGKMERRNGPPTTVTVTCDPKGKAGVLEGWLCFILPEEKAFSTYYYIRATAQ